MTALRTPRILLATLLLLGGLPPAATASGASCDDGDATTVRDVVRADGACRGVRPGASCGAEGGLERYDRAGDCRAPPAPANVSGANEGLALVDVLRASPRPCAYEPVVVAGLADSKLLSVSPAVAGKPIVHNATLDVTFAGLGLDGMRSVALHDPLGGQIGPAATTDATGDAATFGAIRFTSGGCWSVSAEGRILARFVVSPAPDLVVTIVTMSQREFTYATLNATFTLDVGPLAPGAKAWIFDEGHNVAAGTNVAGPGGRYVFFGKPAQAGTFTVYAFRDAGSTGDPEGVGSATYTVNPAGVSLFEDDVGARVGWDRPASWSLKLPEDSLYHYNLTVVQPDGALVFQNTSTAAANPFPRRVCRIAPQDACAPPPAGHVWNTTIVRLAGKPPLGIFTYRPAAVWDAGTHRFQIEVDHHQGRAELAAFEDHIASWQFTPATPPNVTIEVRTSTTAGGRDVEGRPVTSALAPASAFADRARGHTLAVKVMTTSMTTYPPSEVFSARNVTVAGDARHLGAASYDPATGTVWLDGVYPTKPGGGVRIGVDWDRGGEVALAIGRGPSLTGGAATGRVGEPLRVLLAFDAATAATTGQVEIYGPHGDAPLATGPAGSPLVLTPTHALPHVAVGILRSGAGEVEGIAYAILESTRSSALASRLEPTAIMASVPTPVSLTASLPGGQPIGPGAEIHVLTEVQAAAFLATRRLDDAWLPSCPGAIATPAGCVGYTMAAVSEGEAVYRANVTLAPGVYRVLACGGPGTSEGPRCTRAAYDNADGLPALRVEPFRATFEPESIAPGREATLRVRVIDATGAGATGWLRANGSAGPGRLAESGEPVAIRVENGAGEWRVAAARRGAVAWDFEPAGAEGVLASSPVDGSLLVGYDVRASPDALPLGRISTVEIRVLAEDGPAAGLPVKVCPRAASCTSEVSTDAEGIARVPVLPVARGDAEIHVDGAAVGAKLRLFAALVLDVSPAEPVAGQPATIRVAQISSPSLGEADVHVVVTRQSGASTTTVADSHTGRSGEVTMASPAPGRYEVRATKDGFDPATLAFTVGEAKARGPVFEIKDIVAPDRGKTGVPLVVQATVSNVGDQAGTATALLHVNGAQRGTTSLTLEGGATAPVSFDVTPPVAGKFFVAVRLTTGEKVLSKTVTVEAGEGGPQRVPALAPVGVLAALALGLAARRLPR